MRVFLRLRRPPEPARPRARGIPLYPAPRLLLQWPSRPAAFRENLRALLAPLRVSPKMLEGFTVPLRGGAMQPRSLGASLILHVAAVAVLVNLLPILFGARQPTAAELAARRRQKITWYYFENELPHIAQQKSAGPKPSERGGRRPGPAPRGATAWPSRQVIISNPPHPENARQTIVQPDAPNIRITQDVRLPNLVMWAHQPQRPSLEFLTAPDVRLNLAPRLVLPPNVVRPLPPVDLVKRDLARLKAPQLGVTAIEPPAPDVPNLERRVSDLKMAASKALERAPQIAVTPASTAPVTQASSGQQQGGAAAAPAEPPQPLPLSVGGGNGGVGRLIALGINPAPPGGEINVPAGNRAGSFSIAPPGKTPGTPYGALAGLQGAGVGGPAPAGEGSGQGPLNGPSLGAGGREVAEIRVPGLSISGGIRPPPASLGPVVSGPAPAAAPSPAPAPKVNPGALAALVARASRPQVTLPDFPRGNRRAEQGFLPGKRVYTVYINMPNLSSQRGSWILRFAELADRTPGGDEPELTAPVAVRKVDPPYDPNALREGVQGMVVLYAVIHQDGRVDSVRVVRGLDPRLDEGAVNAFRRWEFQPATRNGSPVDLEALVQIPFSASPKPF